jgi:hypothetical protein
MSKRRFLNQKLGKKTSRRQMLVRWKNKVEMRTRESRNQKGKPRKKRD